MVRLALRSALSDRASEGRVAVVDAWRFPQPSTRDAVAALAALDLTGKLLVVVGAEEESTAKSFRNLPHVQLVRPGELNTYDVLCNDWVVFSEANVPSGGGPAADAPASTQGTGAAASSSAGTGLEEAP
jgi:large subunit ribosomal protein L4